MDRDDLQSGQFNQTGALAPRESAEGLVMRAWIARGRIWQHATYLVSSVEYRGFIGAFASRQAQLGPLYSPPLYGGDAPQTLQPTVDALDPWDSPPIGGL